jgi:hypothetical protein
MTTQHTSGPGQGARDFLASLLDNKEDEALDLLTNSGEDVKSRLSEAID